MNKLQLKQMIKESLVEYFSEPLYKIVKTPFLVEDSQQVDDEKVVEANIQGVNKSKIFLKVILDRYSRRYSREYGDIAIDWLDDLNVRIYYSIDHEDMYDLFSIVLQSTYKDYDWVEDFINSPGSSTHPLAELYEEALKSLHITFEYEGLDTIYFYNSNDYYNAEPCGESNMLDEAEFMNDLTKNYLEQKQRRPNYDIDEPYLESIINFIERRLY